MKIIKLLGLILITSLVSYSYAENQNPINEDAIILKIAIPLDNKGDTETGHIAIEYHLRESGFAYDMRSVYDWAQQASRKKQLNQKELKEIIDLVKKLPAPEYEGEKDKSLIVKLYNGKDEKIIKYRQDNLPKELKRIFELLRGIRPDIKDKLEFNL